MTEMEKIDKVEVELLKAKIVKCEKDLHDSQKLGCPCYEKRLALQQAKAQLRKYYKGGNR